MEKRWFYLTITALFLAACTSTRSSSVANGKDDGAIAVVAHRGYWNCAEAGYAQNSVAALKCAQEAGLWGSEFDVNMTKDEVLVVFHDNHTAGMKFEEHTYADFADVRLKNGEPIPTLDDYLQQAQKCRTTKLVFELKAHSTPELEDRAIELALQKLRKAKLLKPQRVMFISFSLHACQRLAESAPGIDVQYLGGNLSPTDVLTNKVPGIDYHFGMFDSHPEWVQEAHSKGMSVNIWTVDKEEDLLRMLSLSPDQLTTNEPMRTRELMQKHGISEWTN